PHHLATPPLAAPFEGDDGGAVDPWPRRALHGQRGLLWAALGVNPLVTHSDIGRHDQDQKDETDCAPPTLRAGSSRHFTPRLVNRAHGYSRTVTRHSYRHSAASQIKAALSPLPETIHFPSGEQATAKTTL